MNFNSIILFFGCLLCFTGLHLFTSHKAENSVGCRKATVSLNSIEESPLMNVEIEIIPGDFNEKASWLTSAAKELANVSPSRGFKKLHDENFDVENGKIVKRESFIFGVISGELYSLDTFEVISVKKKNDVAVVAILYTRVLSDDAEPAPATAYVKISDIVKSVENVKLYFIQCNEEFQPLTPEIVLFPGEGNKTKGSNQTKPKKTKENKSKVSATVLINVND